MVRMVGGKSIGDVVGEAVVYRCKICLSVNASMILLTLCYITEDLSRQSVHSWYFIVSNVGWLVSDSVEWICIEMGVVCEGLRETLRNVSQNNWSVGQDLNFWPPRYVVGVLATWLWHLVFSYSVQCVASLHTFSSVNEFVSLVNLCHILCLFASASIYTCVVRGQYSLCVV